MYGVEGRSWIAMGDPVGRPTDVRELAWSFLELADRQGGWAVFYEIGADHLPLYRDLGLTFTTLGEKARVRLADFGLAGAARTQLREAHCRVAHDGCAFALVPPTEVPALLPALRAVSDAWLAATHTREKGFSLGFFSPDYLARGPVAIVRRGNAIVAFANVLCGGGREELAVDLMRSLPEEAPPGVTDFLLLELMLRGRAEGYRWFSLGLAPCSDRGVRPYEARFDPVWEPRYLASPGGLALPRILADVAARVSGQPSPPPS
jgi:phosphatidylglycerol lysyltransferase